MMHMVQDMLNELPEFEDYVVLTLTAEPKL